MRLFATVAAFCVLTSNAFALEAESWQQQLQAEMNRMQQKSSMLKAQGNVTVTKQDDRLVATLPVLKIVAPGRAQWTIPAITMTAPANAGSRASVLIALPSKISYRDAAGKDRSGVSIGQQTITGDWDFAQNAFTSLNGNLSNVSFIDLATNTSSKVDHVALSAANPLQPRLSAKNLQSTTTANGQTRAIKMDNASVDYQFTGPARLGITRVIGLLNPVWLVAENQVFTLTTTASGASFLDPNGQTSRLESLGSRTTVTPQEGKDMLAAQHELTLAGASQSPETAFGFILPKDMKITMNIKDMPLETLSFAPGRAFEAATQAGTRADITNILWQTHNKASLKGKGWLKATGGVPLGMTGRVDFDLTDLPALIAAVQKQLAQPGAEIAAKTKGLMILMILQGLGKQNGGVTHFTLDMTADGDVLINGNNIAGLLSPGGGTSSAPGLGAALQGMMKGQQN